MGEKLISEYRPHQKGDLTIKIIVTERVLYFQKLWFIKVKCFRLRLIQFCSYKYAEVLKVSIQKVFYFKLVSYKFLNVYYFCIKLWVEKDIICPILQFNSLNYKWNQIAKWQTVLFALRFDMFLFMSLNFNSQFLFCVFYIHFYV